MAHNDRQDALRRDIEAAIERARQSPVYSETSFFLRIALETLDELQRVKLEGGAGSRTYATRSAGTASGSPDHGSGQVISIAQARRKAGTNLS